MSGAKLLIMSPEGAPMSGSIGDEAQQLFQRNLAMKRKLEELGIRDNPQQTSSSSSIGNSVSQTLNNNNNGQRKFGDRVRSAFSRGRNDRLVQRSSLSAIDDIPLATTSSTRRISLISSTSTFSPSQLSSHRSLQLELASFPPSERSPRKHKSISRAWKSLMRRVSGNRKSTTNASPSQHYRNSM